MSAVPVIRIDGMTKRFHGEPAVQGLTLEIPTGAVFGLLGENGAGKTTTLQALLGMIKPDEGRIRTLGLDPVRHGLEVRRRVGYVPEQPVLYDWMTVAEIGWFAAGFHPEVGYQDYYNRLVAGFGLPRDRKIRTLSKGMRAEVSLSLALASQPELLVLDEPTSGLDVLVRREFLESIVDLAGAGRTVLLSSHQMAEVERVASHVALLHKGKLVLAEPLDELRARTFAISLTLAPGTHLSAPPLGAPLELIDVDESARQCRWVVHAPERAACEIARDWSGVLDAVVESPSLEEIYIAYMRGKRREMPAAAAIVV
ncbi:MAG: ABC transporter ATP-binding protein [Isosphaeraceae bacterium]|nr:ABC transporter ATP-binding protein [Isosphaeraceae bacterium]